MGLTKEQLEQLNNNSFPNNNSGYITPDILRTYNDAVIVNTVNQTVYTADSASFNYRINTISPSGLVTKTEFDTYTASADLSVSELSASYLAFTSSYYITSASFNNRINNFNPTNLVTTASFNAYTQSVNTQLANIEAATGSYLTTGSLTSNQYVSGNLVFTEVNTFVTQSTASNLNTHNGTTLEFLAGNISSTYPSLYDIVGFGNSVWSGLRVSGAGLSTPLITNMFISGANNVYVTIASGLSVSGSSYVVSGPLPQNVDFKVNNLIVSGNIVTNQSVLTNTIGANSGDKVTISAGTASVNRLEANNISSSIVSASSVSSLNVNSVSASFKQLNVDSASITYLKVIYETSSVVFSSGSNIFGDDALTDVQTLIGRTIVTGSLEVTGSTKINGDLSSSTLNGIGNVTLFSQSAYNVNATQSYQIVANALTASNALTALSQSLWFTDTTQSANLTNLSSSIYQTDATQSNNIVTLTSKTGSYATTGSNTFVGNQIITGSLIQSSSNTIINVAPGGAAVGTQIKNRVLISGGDGTAGNLTPRLWISGSDGAYNEQGRGYMKMDTTVGTAGDTFLQMYANQLNEAQITIGVYNPTDGSNDIELNIATDITGIKFKDYDQTISDYSNWLTIAPNDGVTIPIPQFVRGLGVTGSASFTQLTGSLGAYSASVNSRIVTNTNSITSLNSFSASITASYNATSASLNAVSSSYNTMSASAVSNVTDTYTSQPLAKYIVTLTQAEYTAISTKDTTTLYVII